MRGVGPIGQRCAIAPAEPVIALGEFDRMLKMAGRKLNAIAVEQRKRRGQPDDPTTNDPDRAQAILLLHCHFPFRIRYIQRD